MGEDLAIFCMLAIVFTLFVGAMIAVYLDIRDHK